MKICLYSLGLQSEEAEEERQGIEALSLDPDASEEAAPVPQDEEANEAPSSASDAPTPEEPAADAAERPRREAVGSSQPEGLAHAEEEEARGAAKEGNSPSDEPADVPTQPPAAVARAAPASPEGRWRHDRFEALERGEEPDEGDTEQPEASSGGESARTETDGATRPSSRSSRLSAEAPGFRPASAASATSAHRAPSPVFVPDAAPYGGAYGYGVVDAAQVAPYGIPAYAACEPAPYLPGPPMAAPYAAGVGPYGQPVPAFVPGHVAAPYMPAYAGPPEPEALPQRAQQGRRFSTAVLGSQ
ncbi:hypothetical protein QBZ16_004790 [Prototheca wickerhamii]|uniref:Uncharacterized protein n=1 Tax=Prototheca wickerhamii TaxID=3111 RepID=A0AAD9IGF6_PROWI|nr:hypothetical protein QBZ16_004790 [Prototheca wickerhamii]